MVGLESKFCKNLSMNAILKTFFNVAHSYNLDPGTKEKSSVVNGHRATCYDDHMPVTSCGVIFFNSTHLLNLDLSTKDKYSIVDGHFSTCYGGHMPVTIYSVQNRNEFRMYVHHNMKSGSMKAIETIFFNVTHLLNLGESITKDESLIVNGHWSIFSLLFLICLILCVTGSVIGLNCCTQFINACNRKCKQRSQKISILSSGGAFDYGKCSIFLSLLNFTIFQLMYLTKITNNVLLLICFIALYLYQNQNVQEKQQEEKQWAVYYH